MATVILDILKYIYAKNNLIWPFHLLVPKLCSFLFLVYSRGHHSPTCVLLLLDVFFPRFFPIDYSNFIPQV